MVEFRKGDFVVYPTHGVGEVTDIRVEEICPNVTEEFVSIHFCQDKMNIKVPLRRGIKNGLRKLADPEGLDKVENILGERPDSRSRGVVWARRAQIYHEKINSGNLCLLAEVVRDLNPDARQKEQSYSEKQIYNIAINRLAREMSAVNDIPMNKVVVKLENVLQNTAIRLQAQGSDEKQQKNENQAENQSEFQTEGRSVYA